MADGKIPEEFEIGEPVLVCRWRLSAGKLPAINRHMRALGRRMVNNKPISKQLVSWTKQHIEWTLADGASKNPDGVLMVMVDAEGRAAMVVGPYEELRDTSLRVLLERARTSELEAANTNVAPETLWAMRDGVLLANLPVGDALSASASLIADLTTTLGFSFEACPELVEEVSKTPTAFSEVFLVSDEHGVVPAADATGPRGTRFADGWQTLLARTAHKGGSAYAKYR